MEELLSELRSLPKENQTSTNNYNVPARGFLLMATKEAKSNDSAIGLLGGLITRNYEDNEIEEINAKNLIDRMNKELHASNDRTAIFNSFIEALTY